MRRAEAASGRKPVDRAEVIRLAHDFLANTAAPTVTGATVAENLAAPQTLYAARAATVIGSRPSGSRVIPAFAGKVDELAIFNRPLSAEERVARDLVDVAIGRLRAKSATRARKATKAHAGTK